MLLSSLALLLRTTHITNISYSIYICMYTQSGTIHIIWKTPPTNADPIPIISSRQKPSQLTSASSSNLTISPSPSPSPIILASHRHHIYLYLILFISYTWVYTHIVSIIDIVAAIYERVYVFDCMRCDGMDIRESQRRIESRKVKESKAQI